MPRFLPLSDNDRQSLRELQDLTGLQQKEIAERVATVRISQPWISQLLTGSRPSVDPEMLEAYVNELVFVLKNRPADDQFPPERRRAAFSFLSRFTQSIAFVEPYENTRPGGCVPLGAFYYLETPRQEEVFAALALTPFALMVTGPVQCGKSSLLARLEHRARGIGFDTAWFDPILPIGQLLEGSGGSTTPSVVAASALYEQLQDQWGLEPRKEGVPDSLSKLVNWFRRVVAVAASKPRLLIIDDLGSLGLDGAEEWMALFVRAIYNMVRQERIDLSICVGMTIKFAPQFQRRISRNSSIVNWEPRIDLGWLDESDTRKLVQILNKEALDLNSSNYVSGQPYLTHAFAADREFREAIVNWDANREDPESIALLRRSRIYKRHLSAIRSAIIGPALKPAAIQKRLIEAFDRRLSLDEDQRSFLQQARLIGDGEYVLPMYRLMAHDLRVESEQMP